MSYDSWKTDNSHQPMFDTYGGRPDDGYLPECKQCDECRCDAIFPITLAGLGTFCSAGCADVASVKHEAAMTPYPLKESA